MYESFYRFIEKPFNITPDPKYLFLSPKHREALGHVMYGIKERAGFVVITGEIGTGKTILCRYLLNQLDRDTEGAVILNPNLSELELLRAINEDFGIESRATTKKGLIDELNQFLLHRRLAGKNMVLVIDEAQNLAPAVLEQIRLLSNLETEKEKLIQIILLGQPELRDVLARPDLEQLNQRITARYHLSALDRKETEAYIKHRLAVAGGRPEANPFPARTLRRIYRHTRGVPRRINILCDRLLLAGFAAGVYEISPGMVKQAAHEVSGPARPKPLLSRGRVQLAAYAATGVLCLGLGWGVSRVTGVESVSVAEAGMSRALPAAPAPRAPAPTPPAPTVTTAEPAPQADPPAAAHAPSPRAPAQPEPTPAPAPASTAPPQPKASPAATPAPAPTVAKPAPKAATPPAPKPAAKPAPAAPAPAPRPVRVAAVPEPEERPAPAPAPVASVEPDPGLDEGPPPVPVRSATEEKALISSLFDLREPRVVKRTPSVLEESLPPPQRQTISRAPASAPPAPPVSPAPQALRLTTAEQLRRVVGELDPLQSRLDAACALFRLWGRDFQIPKEADDPNFHDFYKLALNQAMRCSEVWANFETLGRINLPVILEVFTPDAPASRYVVLAAIHADGTGTILWDTNASARVDLQALDESWRRRAFVFWQDVEPLGEVVKEGDAGEHVRWLQARLHELGYLQEAPSGTYDPATRRAVAAFQQAYNLHPDGVVGPRTRMVLYSRLPTYATPNLTSRGGDAT